MKPTVKETVKETVTEQKYYNCISTGYNKFVIETVTIADNKVTHRERTSEDNLPVVFQQLQRIIGETYFNAVAGKL